MKRIANILAGVAAFGLGLAVTWGIWILRGDAGSFMELPPYILLAGVGVGIVGAMLREIGLGLVRGKAFFAAAGIDESRTTSGFVLILAAVLFVPLWGGLLALLIGDIWSSASPQRVAVLAGITVVLTGVVLGLVREWRRKPEALQHK